MRPQTVTASQTDRSKAAEGIAQRLEFLKFSDADRAALVGFRPVLEKHLPDILEKFYSHIRHYPHLIEKFGGEANLARAKKAQAGHWLGIFAGNFDADYAERVRRIGQTHERIGLEPSWYMGGYVLALNEISRLVQEKYRWHTVKATACLNAIQKALMLDMELSVSVYLEVGKEVHQQALSNLAEKFEGSVTSSVVKVSGQAVQIGEQATGLSRSSNDSAERLSAVAAASEQASANVQTVASAAEELSASIAEITRQVSQSTIVAGRAVDEAGKATQAVTALSDAAVKIGKIVELINAVANKTNLLALNATIEAARAGEAGKGFAVVASEVKALANQTSRATSEIEEEVRAMRATAEGSVQAIGRISQVIGQMNEVSTAIAAAVEEQGAATSEIARNVQEAAAGTSDVSGHVIGLKQVVQHVSSASGDVLSACRDLNVTFEQVKADVREFVTTLRAG
jgi:methyl-accepting chemotaxis protein